MKLFLSKNPNLNYVATVVQVENFFPHPNADRLKLTTVNGCTISVSTDAQPGVYIYFPLESKLSDTFLSKNNLYRKTLNKNVNPEESGFFEVNGRVKCVKLRGMYSEGFIIPIKALNVYGEEVVIPEIGTKFDTIEVNNCVDLICKKYTIPIASGSGSKLSGQKQIRKYEDVIVPDQFRFHPDTPKLKENLHCLNLDDYIHISYKMHGTSAIFCNLLVNKDLKWYEKILSKLGVNITTSEYKKFCASRKVIKDPDLNKGTINNYYNFDIWNAALDVIKDHLHQGMTIYAEIVGYLPSGATIQKEYDYGCEFKSDKHCNENGEMVPIVDYTKLSPIEMYKRNLFKIYVYRITYTSADGQVFEMSATDLQKYCLSHGLVPVPQLWYGQTSALISKDEDWRDELLQVLSNKYLEKDCTICKNKVPAEGIVIRTMKPKFEAYKLKSLRFFEHESKELDAGIVNIEDNQ